jgi:hypothetical protein
MRSSTLEITYSAVLEMPTGEEDDGGGGGAYGVGVVEDREGRVVWRETTR